MDLARFPVLATDRQRGQRALRAVQDVPRHKLAQRLLSRGSNDAGFTLDPLNDVLSIHLRDNVSDLDTCRASLGIEDFGNHRALLDQPKPQADWRSAEIFGKRVTLYNSL